MVPRGLGVVWKLPGCQALNKMLCQSRLWRRIRGGPTKITARIERGRKKSCKGQRVDPKDWEILIPNYPEGYAEQRQD
jgi:hypothetical protein